VALADLAEDGVDQAAAFLADLGAGQRDHLGHGGVRVHPHAEELVGAEAEEVEELGVEVSSGRDTLPARKASYVPCQRSVPCTSSVQNAASRPPRRDSRRALLRTRFA
jgi:hypothetical protein